MSAGIYSSTRLSREPWVPDGFVAIDGLGLDRQRWRSPYIAICVRCVRETGLVSAADRTRAYTTTLEPMHGNKARVPVPFDPNEAWGTKREHHVNGNIAGMRVRVTIAHDDAGWSFSLSPARLLDGHVGPGDDVEVVISPEGPQRSDLAPDLFAALEANPEAGAFFDTLAQFYRNSYLRWIDGTKRRPDVRAQRIAEMICLLNDGIKERPRL